MVRFTRTFHTVGQGAFYSEKIEYNDKCESVVEL